MTSTRCPLCTYAPCLPRCPETCPLSCLHTLAVASAALRSAHPATPLLQVVPLCREEWESQVGSGLADSDAELDEKEKWGSYPRLRDIKKAHKAMFDDIQ